MIPNVQFDAPIMITKGGTYTGNFKGEGKPAIEVNTTEQVIITGCVLTSDDQTILMCYGGSNVKITQNKFYGLQPPSGKQWGRAVNAWGSKSFVFEHNYMEHTGGIMVEQSQAPVPSVTIRYNKSLNVDKRRGDGSTGDHRAGIMISTIRNMVGAEIAWNEFVNFAGESFIEDNINIYNSGGTQASSLLIHNNYIYGAYPMPVTADSFSGSGITVDGTPADNTLALISKFIEAYDNQVLECGNACMNIATGHEVHFSRNKMMATGLAPDGTKLKYFWAGCCIWNGSKVSEDVFKNNTIEGNTIGYMHHSSNNYYPFPGRHDEMNLRYPNGDNRMPPGKNTHMPEGSVTKAAVDAEYPIWQKKLSDNKIVIGPGDNGIVDTIPELKIKVGQTALGEIIPINKAGETVGYKPGTLTVKSADDKIFTVIVESGKIKIVGVSAGKATGAIGIASLGGKLITKTFNVEIVANDAAQDNEAVDIIIKFIVP